MAANFSQTDSFPVAISKTFDGKNPCKLCKVVSEGKNADKESEAKLNSKKIDSFFAVKADFYFAPLQQSPASPVSILYSHIEAPLSPPPRAA